LEILRRVEEISIDKEIIVVDDGSFDGTRELLKNIEEKPNLIIIYHFKNTGKGAAVHSALKKATGQITIIQDADLEYDPNDYLSLIQPILDKKTKVVYGSRRLKNNSHSSFVFYFGSRLITIITNLLFGSRLTDLNTGYKTVDTEVLRGLNLECRGFEFCEEVTVKLLRRKHFIYEVPISYHPRDFKEGKKICWKDGLKAIGYVLKMRFNCQNPNE
jgi:glycosyltransferase involved in cell wall biosynthesis